MTEIATSTEVLTQVHKRTRLSKAGAAVAIGIFPAEVALTDSLFVRAQNFFVGQAGKMNMGPAAEFLYTRGMTSLVVVAESALAAGIVMSSSGAKGALDSYEEYTEDKKKTMTGARKVASTVMNSPLTFLMAMGKKFEKAGQRFERSDSGAVRGLGKFAVASGETNMLSTTGAIISEMGNEDGVSVRRAGFLIGSFAATWAGTIEAVRYGYRGIGQIPEAGHPMQRGIAAAGNFLYDLTSINPADPLAHPLSLVVMPSVVAACATIGYRADRYHEAQQLEPTFAPAEFPPEAPAA